METQLVRLKPFDASRRHVLRRYHYAGHSFREERGWHRVTKEVADYLRTVRQVADDAGSPLAFDVATEEEARALESAEEEAKRRHAAADPIDATGAVASADLKPTGIRRGRG